MKNCILLAVIFYASKILAQSGNLDPSFNGNGYRMLRHAPLRAIAYQSDGKILAAGTAQLSTSDFFVVRYNIDGSVDNTFKTNGKFFPSRTFSASALAIQPDGKIVIAGRALGTNGRSDMALARYNQDGTLDATFADIGIIVKSLGFNSELYAVAIQSDGKIIVGGSIGTNAADFLLIRFNSNGTPDSSFGQNSLVVMDLNRGFDIVTAIALQSDGKILAAGDGKNIDTDFALVRYNVDGSPDNTFGSKGVVLTVINSGGTSPTDAARSMALQVDGRIVLAGWARNTTASFNGLHFAITRYSPNGSLDSSFGNNGKVITDFGPFHDVITSVVVQPNNKIIVGGGTQTTNKPLNAYNVANDNYDFALMRYNPDGTLDGAFGNKGKLTSNFRENSMFDSYDQVEDIFYVNGKLYVAGVTLTYKEVYYDSTSGLIARYDVPDLPFVCVTPTFVNNSLIVLDATCANNDGNISIIPTTGTAPFMYSKDGGITYVAGPNTGLGFANLTAGIYKLRLKDAYGCQSEIVEKVVKRNCTTTCTPPTFVNNGLIVLDATCSDNDGGLFFTPLTGTAPFVYSIDGGANYVSGTSIGKGFNNLASGTHRLRMKDANGCESAIVEKIVKRTCATTCTPPTFVNNALIVLDATCNNDDGGLFFTPLTGTAPFVYSIDGGASYVSGTSIGKGFNNLPSGTYRLRMKDANGCESEIVEKVVKRNCATSCTPPTFVNNGLIVLDPTCNNNDGGLFFEPLTGTAPFVYSIDGGANYVSGTNIGKGFNNLASGTYRLRMKDANGCESAIVEKTLRINGGSACGSSEVATDVMVDEILSTPAAFVKVYPNPNTGQFRIKFQKTMSPQVEVSILDAKGTLIQKRSLNLTQNSTIDFDLTGNAPGLYLIKAVSGKESKTSKVLIQ